MDSGSLSCRRDDPDAEDERLELVPLPLVLAPALPGGGRCASARPANLGPGVLLPLVLLLSLPVGRGVALGALLLAGLLLELPPLLLLPAVLELASESVAEHISWDVSARRLAATAGQPQALADKPVAVQAPPVAAPKVNKRRTCTDAWQSWEYDGGSTSRLCYS